MLLKSTFVRSWPTSRLFTELYLGFCWLWLFDSQSGHCNALTDLHYIRCKGSLEKAYNFAMIKFFKNEVYIERSDDNSFKMEVVRYKMVNASVFEMKAVFFLMGLENLSLHSVQLTLCTSFEVDGSSCVSCVINGQL